MLVIDGTQGEGGGQILRSSLSLSLVTGEPFRITGIRAGRAKPGLMRQHLTAVKAARDVGAAEVAGDTLGSQELTFSPSTVAPGRYHFTVGTAGSATLVLQTVLPALLTAPAPSTLTLEGGTHNPFAPPFEFLAQAFLPVVRRMGAGVTATLERPGFYPAGGGRITARIEAFSALQPVDLLERGRIKSRRARAVVAKLPLKIAERELRVLERELGWNRSDLRAEECRISSGPGNVLIVIVECEHATEVFTGFGQKGVPAEKIAHQVAREVQRFLPAEVPVGRHLADQLLIPMALSGGGRFLTVAPSRHLTTNAAILRLFLAVQIAIRQQREHVWEIVVSRR
jgi:RNA 3'-terminal phosphate cyclase (ATP)